MSVSLHKILAANIRKRFIANYEPMDLTILGSGSRGNASVLQNNESSILIDAGLSYKTLIKRLKKGKIPLESIAAVMITHEHVDHICGLGAFIRMQCIPVYINAATFKNLHNEIREDIKNCVEFLKTGEKVEINNITIQSLPVRHDAAEPVGFTFTSGGKKIGFVTDIGSVTDSVVHYLKGASVLALEANHDIAMLWNGKYPDYLKQRISGPYGHLSNDDALGLIQNIICEKLQAVYLLHLSKENNRPDVAFRAVHDPLVESYRKVPEIRVTSQDEVSETYTL